MTTTTLLQPVESSWQYQVCFQITIGLYIYVSSLYRIIRQVRTFDLGHDSGVGFPCMCYSEYFS